ncbi:type II toxin-antitoxin system VapC family toxin [Agrobacterium pusense]|uniref:type II toxin-antitoxin system VapC family toxin n=1 Tax=Agrobacterium pusense TaxID=648995 RepID=UPI0028A982FB|nr:type II toxin-antitoxin system VapC family toxin [Agrobacterium pusense]
MRYLLDTNILSNITKPEPSASLLTWMAEQVDDDLFIASLTIAEIHRGILEKPAGKKRAALETWFRGKEGPQSLFAGRILPFDEKAALVTGRPRSALDTIVAAIAQSNNCVVVTDNVRDFQGIEIINPLRTSAI